MNSQVYLQYCAKAIDSTGGKDCSPLAVALVQIVHEKNTAISSAVYTRLHSREPIIASQWVSMYSI
jgi:hypothetical protein